MYSVLPFLRCSGKGPWRGGEALGTENKSGRSWTAKRKQSGPWGGGTILCPDFASGYMYQLIELYTKTKKVTLWIVNLKKELEFLPCSFFFFFLILLIYLFIFYGCVGSSFLCEGFL